MVISVLAPSCATPIMIKPAVKAIPSIDEKSYVSFDGDSLGYKKWPAKDKPHTVIIGVHGISGHAGDYQNLGKHLAENHTGIALYAPETRGQGMDPQVWRKGDIRHAEDWYKDLYTFSDLVSAQHPDAELIWFGESMGSLIVTHAYESIPPHVAKPRRLILSSPILDVGKKIPAWKRNVVRATSFLLPKLRVSLETLSNGEKPTVTQQDIHEQQAAVNPWYIPRYTLRLLLSLADMADGMPQAINSLRCPLLILHGGNDIFTDETSVKKLEGQLAKDAKITREFYPGSYHLLMYDHDREKIFGDVSKWITKEP